MKPIKRLGIVCALTLEAKGIIERLSLVEQEKPESDLPIRFFTGISRGVEIGLHLAGMDPRYQVDNIGSNGAVLSTYLLIDKFKPDLLLNPGTAGGFREKKAEIGDVYVGQNEVRFHDRRTPVKKYQHYCRGHYPVHPAPQMIRELGLKQGIVSSGNSFDWVEVDYQQLIQNGADLKDMEAAAIGWVSWQKQIPFIPIKAVTDFIEEVHTVEEQFNRNWKLACLNLSQSVEEIIAYLSDRELNDL